MYVQVTTTSTSTTATSTKTNHQAPRTTNSSVSLLLTVALAGPVLVTLIWSEDAARELGVVDGLAVIAGGWTPGRLEETSEGDLEDMLSANLRAHLWTVKAFLKLMRPGSSIVLTSSIWGPFSRSPGALAYTASKAAAAALVEVLAAELIQRGIRANGVAPGSMSRGAGAPALGAPSAPPEYVADAVVWLLTDEARWVNGALIPVDGGRRLAAP